MLSSGQREPVNQVRRQSWCGWHGPDAGEMYNACGRFLGDGFVPLSRRSFGRRPWDAVRFIVCKKPEGCLRDCQFSMANLPVRCVARREKIRCLRQRSHISL